MNIKYYEGDRISLRPIELADEPLLRQWLNDPENWRSLKRFLPVNSLREREYIEKLYQSPAELVLGIALQDGGELIGVTGLHGIDTASRRATFGILIGPLDKQGRGYGTEAVRLMVRYAFRELNLNRISLSVFNFNQRGIRAYERAGFVREGCSRQAFWRNGAFHDELHYGLLREDYDHLEREAYGEHARLASMST